jgi:hypothetical protein
MCRQTGSDSLTQSCWVTAGKALTIDEGRVQCARRVATRSHRPLAGCYLTGLVEPCGALPRRCLFIYLIGFTFCEQGLFPSSFSKCFRAFLFSKLTTSESNDLMFMANTSVASFSESPVQADAHSVCCSSNSSSHELWWGNWHDLQKPSRAWRQFLCDISRLHLDASFQQLEWRWDQNGFFPFRCFDIDSLQLRPL